MPTKRRRIGATRIGGALSDRQHAELLVGFDILAFGGAGIESDAQGLMLWRRHRAALMADQSYNSTYPGRRPHGFWRYEIGLTPKGCSFHWPGGCVGEGHMIHKMIVAGQLAPIVPNELDIIEGSWMRAMGQYVRCNDGVVEALAHCQGVPPAFTRKHLSRLLAEREASSAAWRAQLESTPQPPLH